MAKITFFSLGSGGGGGGVDSVTAVSPITSTGGTNPVISSLMNTQRLIGRSSSGSGVMEEIQVGDGLDLIGGVLSNTATPTPLGYYGAWQDDFTQSASANNVGVAMIFRQTDLSNGVSVVSNGTNLTRISFAHTGVYNIQFSSQFQNTDNALHDVTIWLRKNGLDVAGSSGFVSVPSRKSVSDYGHVVVSWNYLLEVIGGEYYELIWSTTDYTKVTMEFYSAGDPPPATASVILTVTQQSGIMAGTGITALNGLTADVQTFATGTTGTNFGISSSGSTHTFNLPTASASNRGALSSTDWSTFNGKQDALGYTPENVANKKTTMSGNETSNVFYLTAKAIYDWAVATFQTIITGGASSIVSSNLTISRALVSDASGKVAVATTTSTEMGYLSGVTSAIQTQLNSKQASLPYTPVYVYAKNSSTFNSSGTGTQILTSVLIPANTFTTGDVIRVTARFKKTGTAGTTQSNILLNTSASTSGATIFKANVFATNTLASGMQSEGVIINNTTNTQLVWTATNLGTTDLVNSTSAWQESIAINWTTNQYLIFSCNPNGAGDVVSLIYYQIEKL